MQFRFCCVQSSLHEDPEKDLEWNDKGIEGASRFLNRLWRLVDELEGASVAPAFLSNLTILALVVPLTIESSTMITLLPSTVLSTAFSFIFRRSSRYF